MVEIILSVSCLKMTPIELEHGWVAGVEREHMDVGQWSLHRDRERLIDLSVPQEVPTRQWAMLWRRNEKLKPKI